MKYTFVVGHYCTLESRRHLIIQWVQFFLTLLKATLEMAFIIVYGTVGECS